MRSLHLFAGAGGGLLADLILGHEPICAVEWDPYCCTVLRERAADGWFPKLHVHEGDVRLFDPSPWAGRVDCVHAGFPCQPFARPGLKLAEADEKNMWPAVVSVARAIRPRYLMLENSPDIISFPYFHAILGDIATMGYRGRYGIIPGSAVGAPHNRARWWGVFDSHGVNDSDEVPHGVQGWQGSCPWKSAGTVGEIVETFTNAGVLRMDDGFPAEMDRFKGCGNAQVPLQAAAAWRILSGQ